MKRQLKKIKLTERKWGKNEKRIVRHSIFILAVAIQSVLENKILLYSENQ